MTCSLQTYRSRIGTFYQWSKTKTSCKRKPKTLSNPGTYLIILLVFLYFGLIANGHSMNQLNLKTSLSKESTSQQTSQIDNWNYSEYFNLVWDPGIVPHLYQAGTAYHSRTNEDPIENIRTTGAGVFIWLDNSERNRLTHINYGNRGHRGKGMNIVYWNKGLRFKVLFDQDMNQYIN